MRHLRTRAWVHLAALSWKRELLAVRANRRFQGTDTYLSFLGLGRGCLQMAFAPRKRRFSSRKKTVRQRSVGRTCRKAVIRFLRLMLKLRPSILHFSGGVLRLRSPPPTHGLPSLWAGGVETQNLVLGAPGDPQCAP
ncbi:hypothetical protein TcG_08821 [Trypanosoma cruzi]|nr:hypothetical protein TcG_08821 [Trypanosoma cruzi]